MRSKRRNNTLVYIVSIGIALVVGFISALLSMKGMKEFADLTQPPLSPPGWLFPVVWTILYTLMGISAARVYIENTADTPPALWLYAFQLLVNALWSPIFFSLKLRLVAFVWLLILVALVIAMIGKFKRVDAPAGNLQFPYLIWLLFAGYLNLAVFLLNG
mgnify:CR=1 FL=1